MSYRFSAKSTLSDACELITDGTHFSPASFKTGEFMYITSKNVREARLDLTDITYVSRDVHNSIFSGCPVRFGDVLYVKDGANTGLAAINTIKQPFSMLSSVALIRPKGNKLDAKYLMHWLNSPQGRAQMLQNMSGAAIKRLVLAQIRRAAISLPPIGEQRRIAVILDQADDLRRKRREALARLNELSRAVFLSMFGDPVANYRQWLTLRLGDAGTLDRGVSKHRPRNDPLLLGGPYPLIQTGDIANCDGYLRSYVATYSDSGLKQSRLWPGGTLCITIAANIGKTGILTFPACFPDSVVGFRSNNQFRTEFVQQWFGFIQPALEKDAPQFAQKNINLAILRDLRLIAPPLTLQTDFATSVTEIDKLKAHHRAHLAKLDALFASLQHRAFRGEL